MEFIDLGWVEGLAWLGDQSWLRVICYVIISTLFMLRAGLRAHYRWVFVGLTVAYGLAIFFALALATGNPGRLPALRGAQTFTILWVMIWSLKYGTSDMKAGAKMRDIRIGFWDMLRDFWDWLRRGMRRA